MMEAKSILNFLTGPCRRQQGASLIELLIGVTVGLIILAGALALFASMLKSSKTNLAMTNMDQELRAVMDIMVRNIRWAGYYGKAPTDGNDMPDYGPNNPFQDDSPNNYQMTLGGTPYGDTCDSDGKCPCITFSYDVGTDAGCSVGLDSAGTTCATHENFGFRYDSAHDAIEMRNLSSGPPSCSEGGWIDITDDSVAVENLTFQYENRDFTTRTKPLALNISFPQYNLETASRPANNYCSDKCACLTDNPPCSTCPCGCPYPSGATDQECLQMRTVIVTIDAHLRCRATDPSGKCKNDDDKTTMSIRERVKVPNDRFCTGSDLGGPSC